MKKIARARGVSWASRNKKWRAQIQVSGKKINLGHFSDHADAVKARHDAEMKYYGKLDNLPPRELHGMGRSKEYAVWKNMKNRCLNPSCSDYENYGGRGITICDSWRASFEKFLSDMGPKPAPGLTIERIDNDLGYCPENCCWASKTTQARNHRIQKNNKSGVPGVCWHKATSKWQARIKVNSRYIHLGLFDTIDDAAAARKAGEIKFWGKSP